jgi:hypothetical protein
VGRELRFSGRAALASGRTRPLLLCVRPIIGQHGIMTTMDAIGGEFSAGDGDGSHRRAAGGARGA